MPGTPIKDPARDFLLTPTNCALVIIDYQPVQVSSIASMDRTSINAWEDESFVAAVHATVPGFSEILFAAVGQ